VRKSNMDLYKEQKDSRKLLDSEELQFHFETVEEFEFTAYNFFPVNISLIGSLILSGTTYLVTLLQFTPSGMQKSE
ncbi:Gustatory receptor 123, partial [Halyomorpha halys]